MAIPTTNGAIKVDSPSDLGKSTNGETPADAATLALLAIADSAAFQAYNDDLVKATNALVTFESSPAFVQAKAINALPIETLTSIGLDAHATKAAWAQLDGQAKTLREIQVAAQLAVQNFRESFSVRDSYHVVIKGFGQKSAADCLRRAGCDDTEIARLTAKFKMQKPNGIAPNKCAADDEADFHTLVRIGRKRLVQDACKPVGVKVLKMHEQVKFNLDGDKLSLAVSIVGLGTPETPGTPATPATPATPVTS